MFNFHLQALLAETGLSLLVSGIDLPRNLLYLDPGTGSLLFSVIVGIAGTAYFVAKDLLYRAGTRVRLLLSPRSGAALHEAQRVEHPVVFYSEGRQYQTTFGPLLQNMQRRGLPCLYLSSDAEDPLLALGLNGEYPLLRTECIGNGHMAWARLRTLRARLVCMTTPGLDVLQIRRSPHVQHYMHVVHSPTDKSFNRPYSFDFFDSVLINGPHQERVIRCLEEVRGRKRKELFSVGCVYYDSLVARYAAAQELCAVAAGGAPRRALRVLLAPTWGKNGLLTRHGSTLIRAIAKAGLELIIRPHPQSVRSEAELLGRLQQECASLPNCRWDFNADPVEAMAMSDILVSDISGIVFDYAFLVGRPVLTMDFSVDKRGFEAMDLPFEPWELTSLELIGRRIGLDDIPALPAIIREETASQARAAQIRQLRNSHVLNFGHASEAAVERMAQLAGLDAQPQVVEAAVGTGLLVATPRSA
jgi:hypothetical protein